MTKQELIYKIKKFTLEAYQNVTKAESSAVEYEVLTQFPELKAIIIDLLTYDFNSFLSSIDWVAPRPTTFRINLKNDQEFYLIYNKKDWIAQIEGKKYFLLDLSEEEAAAEAIARILKHGVEEEEEVEDKETDFNNDEEFDIEEP